MLGAVIVVARDPGESMPAWAKLAAELRRSLTVSEFEEPLPSESDIAETYGVSRQTVREAIRRLRAEGLLHAHQGVGRFSIRRRLLEPANGSRSLSHSIRDLGLQESSEVLRAETGKAGASASLLDLQSGDAVVRIERLRHAGDEPISLDRSVLALDPDSARAVLEADLTRGALSEILEECCGITVVGGTEQVRAVIPDLDERRLLELPSSAAVLEIEHLAYAEDRPIEWRRSIVRADIYGFVCSWGRTPTEAERAVAFHGHRERSEAVTRR